MRWWQVTFLGSVSLLSRSDATFSPNVTVISCASQRVVVQLENAAEDGLIFIQGHGTSCNRTTVAEKKSYEFDFELCNIEYDTKFRIVVQKKPKYQTGYDKVIPVMCIVDTSDLFVSGVVFPEEKLDSSFVNKTVRPTVSMRILAPDSIESVNEVSLNDQVLLSLRLDDPYLDDFDIKAKDCRAEMINLVENEYKKNKSELAKMCSKDEELFPNFERKSKGDITSAFQAFQPTNLDGQAEVDVSFTCSVAVCKGECHKKLCGQIIGWGRKRRDDEDVDENDDGDDNDDVYEKVTCATKLKVKSPEQKSFLDGVTSELKGKLCAEKVAVASAMALTLFTLVISWIVCACVTSKLRSVTRLSDGPNKPSTLRRLSEKNINFARSVGRRLSHMLNIPIGYNMRDPKMMHECIPETDPSPPAKRRDSVTVSQDNETDSNPYVNELFMHTADKQSGFRRRFVDSSVQTDPVCSTLTHSKQDLAKSSQLNSKKKFSFITSISIKSGLSQSRPRSESFPEPTSPICHFPFKSNTNEHLPSGTICINNTTNESVIQYSAEDVPKVRNVYNVQERNKFDHYPQMKMQTDENMTEDYANISLNDGYKEDFDMAPFEKTLKNGENETDIQSRSTDETESDDVLIVDEVMPEPIEFVASHKRERTSSTHV